MERRCGHMVPRTPAFLPERGGDATRSGQAFHTAWVADAALADFLADPTFVLSSPPAKAPPHPKDSAPRTRTWTRMRTAVLRRRGWRRRRRCIRRCDDSDLNVFPGARERATGWMTTATVPSRAEVDADGDGELDSPPAMPPDCGSTRCRRRGRTGCPRRRRLLRPGLRRLPGRALLFLVLDNDAGSSRASTSARPSTSGRRPQPGHRDTGMLPRAARRRSPRSATSTTRSRRLHGRGERPIRDRRRGGGLVRGRVDPRRGRIG